MAATTTVASTSRGAVAADGGGVGSAGVGAEKV